METSAAPCRVRLAYIVLAHTDPSHIVRLCRKLAAGADVFVHIEKNTPVEPFAEPLQNVPNVHFITPRLHCRWGGWNAVTATVNLLRAALAAGGYDRIVFLQGADYPIKTAQEIQAFFASHRETEFIRACDVTASADPYFKEMCRVVFFRNHEDIVHKVLEKLMQHGRIYLRNGSVPLDSGGSVHAYWGSAQWAITGKCAEYIVNFYDTHPEFDRWFYHAFPTDEMYFATVVMNSPFREKTTTHGPEPAQKGLVNWRNLHYFEYPGSIRVYGGQDYDFVHSLPELYIRKVNTEKSTELLNRLDALENEQKEKA